MMNFLSYFRQVFLTKILELEIVAPIKNQLEWQEKITVEVPRERHHGDLATNIALIIAKPLMMENPRQNQPGQNPKAIATHIAAALLTLPEVVRAEVAGPGFINVEIAREFWWRNLGLILAQGEGYGTSNLGNGNKVNIEFVSTNPTGPMHTGHGRNAVLGDTLASLLQKVGYDVCREYYVNDAGGQVYALARSVYLRYCEAAGRVIDGADFNADMYPADYLIPVGQAILRREGVVWLNEPEDKWLEHFRGIAVQEMLSLIRQDLECLGVRMDVYTSERELVETKQVEQALDILRLRGDVYQGVLEQPKGHAVEDWEPRPQTLFRATSYGDDVDRPLVKSDGSWTYFASDIAYHLYKFNRGFDQLIDIFGADHSGYVKRLQSAVRAVTNQQAKFEIKVCQMVNFMDKGEPVRMSKRAGTFITIREVVEKVGRDAARFMMVSRHQDIAIDFDFAKVIEQTRDNPIFYIQYAHARIQSVLRHCPQVFPELDHDSLLNHLALANFSCLNDKDEIATLKVLAAWPNQVEVAAKTREPHRIANALHQVASQFHSLWNRGKDNNELRFIDPKDIENTKARLALIKATAYVIASGLKILGITPTQEMR